ncbi:MAG: OmpA family protein [Pseudomonadota bacterium]
MRFLFAFSVTVLFSIISATTSAQALRDSLFEQADAVYTKAREADAAMLAPRNFERGEKAYAAAEDALAGGRNVETVRSRLADAVARFNQALTSIDVTRPVVNDALATRQDAMAAQAQQLSEPIWDDAQRKLADAVRALERGDLKAGKRYALEAESLFRDAELGAIKTRYLSDTRRLLGDAERAKVSRYAPLTLAKSKSLLAQAEKELNENRYDTDLPRSLAQQANYEARHAIYLAEVVRRIRDDDLTVEELVLKWEGALTKIAGAADIVPDMANGGETLADTLVSHVVALQADNQALGEELANTSARADEMAEEIRLLDEKLGGATAERASLMQRLQQQARIKEQFETVEQMFERSEAVVFRTGDTVTLRLVGLTFASGDAQISADYFPLLEKVEAAIDVFPRSLLDIEGHTDSYGSDASNLTLSQQRADAVQQYMLNAMRIPSSRITATGFGEARPIANNETADGRARNRRIDIVITSQVQ